MSATFICRSGARRSIGLQSSLAWKCAWEMGSYDRDEISPLLLPSFLTCKSSHATTSTIETLGLTFNRFYKPAIQLLHNRYGIPSLPSQLNQSLSSLSRCSFFSVFISSALRRILELLCLRPRPKRQSVHGDSSTSLLGLTDRKGRS